MKPFNLEEAKAGKPLVTRDGRHVVFGCFNEEAIVGHELVCFLDRRIYAYHPDGSYAKSEKSELDIFMKTVKKTVYLNIWEHGNGLLDCSSFWHPTKEAAETAFKASTDAKYLAIAVPIEIEE